MDDDIFVHFAFVYTKSDYVPESEMDEKRLTLNRKISALTLCSIVFSVVYNFAAWQTSKLENVPSFVFDFEKHIPFLAWTIVPYLTSGLFFFLVFLWCKNREQLKVLTQRMLFVTVIAGIFFLILVTN